MLSNTMEKLDSLDPVFRLKTEDINGALHTSNESHRIGHRHYVSEI